MNLKTWLVKEDITQAELAEILGLTSQAINRWFVGFSVPSSEHIWKIWELTNGEVLPSDLRPDLYPEKPLKKIYGCVRCRDKSPENYKEWFHSLEEATLERRRYGRSTLQKEKVSRMKKMREEESEKEQNV
ncbi:MAG: helix-turn-helix domain-containing protein [Neisseriaceae bacterium]|nr:helix-turn-helix domain-containing protein [Neisseriaceae bacterium]